MQAKIGQRPVKSDEVLIGFWESNRLSMKIVYHVFKMKTTDANPARQKKKKHHFFSDASFLARAAGFEPATWGLHLS
jgi:hypothetical protein